MIITFYLNQADKVLNPENATARVLFKVQNHIFLCNQLMPSADSPGFEMNRSETYTFYE